MAWSTREIAELADTTERTVRHYHQIGLLAEPPRRSNGYKQYGVAHLERILRIKMLTDLGFSLTQVTAMGADDAEPPGHALRDLDVDLAATIETLQRTRARLAHFIEPAAAAEIPVDLAVTRAAAAADLTASDRLFMLVLTRVLGPRVLAAYAESLRSYRDDPASVDFDRLTSGADTDARQDLAERLATLTRRLWTQYPGLQELDARRGTRVAVEAVGTALEDLYNKAQIDVLRRAQNDLNPPHRDMG